LAQLALGLSCLRFIVTTMPFGLPRASVTNDVDRDTADPERIGPRIIYDGSQYGNAVVVE